MFEDGAQDGEQLPHARHQSHFLGLAGAHQPLVELLDDRVEARGHQSPHVQSFPYAVPPAPCRPTASKRAGVSVEGSYAHQGRQLLGREGGFATDLGQLGQEGPGEHGSYYSGYAAQERLVLAPGGALFHRPVEIVVGTGELLFEPLYVRPDALFDGLGSRRAEAVLLGAEHLDDLAPAGDHGAQGPSLLVGEGFGLWTNGLGEAGEDLLTSAKIAKR